MAAATHVVPSTITRYLKGERVAPKEFVEHCAAFLAEHDEALAPADREQLHRLRREAQAASPSAEVRLLHLKEEIDGLKADLDAAHAAHEASTAAAVREAVRQVQAESGRHLAAIEKQLTTMRDQLHAELKLAQQELEEERERAENLGTDNDQLRVTAEAQRRRIEQARDYIRKLTAELDLKEQELARKEEEVRLLHQQTRVLQGQVQTLTAEEEQPVAGAATQVTASAAAALDAVVQADFPVGTRTGVKADGDVRPSVWAQPGNAVGFQQRLRQLRWATVPTDQDFIAQGLTFELVGSITKFDSLPGLEATLAIVRACGGDVAQWAADWNSVASPAPAGASSRVRPTPPHHGFLPALFAVTASSASVALILLNIAGFVSVCRMDNGPAVAVLVVSGMGLAIFTAVIWLALTGGAAAMVEKGSGTETYVALSVVASIGALLVAVIGPFQFEVIDALGLWWARALTPL
ncbi:hypothetical protein [Streptomyces sp. RK75]|uniref:hypothetical protein n=1 Tax=Streptomyces sp. RK75 TaxID=2824895 RepID=UPI001B38D8A4|nr:hypothetical protein [Streptomyces sp. RK75]MBQ0867352.1 hypothetical protein [Streptomyces sp. RK75]